MGHGRKSPPREDVVSVAGGALWTATQGDGPPLVLCHGGPGLCDNLEPVADLLDDHARIHRYDQRGSGRSTSDGPFDVRTFVADLEALRAHWGYDRWIVGGHSWGAALALFYAVAHPASTQGVISISGTGVRWGWQATTRQHRLERLTACERAELIELERRLADTTRVRPGDRDRFLRLMWTTDFASRATAAAVLDRGPLYRCARVEHVFHALAADQRRILETPEFAAGLQRLAAPLLAIHGDGDAAPARSGELAALVPCGRAVLLSRAGHSPWHEAPAEFRASVAGFLRTL
jgi:proline iminopeptidase